jgi:hypothetical protein
VLYQLWSAAGVEFRPHKAITRRLRYTKHSNGHLLTIQYAAEEDWSKNFRDRMTDGALTVQDRVVQRVKQVFADVEFAWMANKDIPDKCSMVVVTDCRTRRSARTFTNIFTMR